MHVAIETGKVQRTAGNGNGLIMDAGSLGHGNRAINHNLTAVGNLGQCIGQRVTCGQGNFLNFCIGHSSHNETDDRQRNGYDQRNRSFHSIASSQILITNKPKLCFNNSRINISYPVVFMAIATKTTIS